MGIYFMPHLDGKGFHPLFCGSDIAPCSPFHQKYECVYLGFIIYLYVGLYAPYTSLMKFSLCLVLRKIRDSMMDLVLRALRELEVFLTFQCWPT